MGKTKKDGWKIVWNLRNRGVFPSFKEASKAFLEIVLRNVKNGISLQILETCGWVESPTSSTIYYFYDVRDICIETGWMENKTGKWIG